MRRRHSLADVGEFGFLRRLLPSLEQTARVLVGPGDDCAVTRGDPKLLLTTDALVEGIHFERSWLTPRQIGAKAVLVNLSDIAAMGGVPRFVLLSLCVPPGFASTDLARLHRGAARAAGRAGAAIVGGNLSAAERLFVSVTVVGAVSRPALRGGARPGDRLFVTGTLGDAAAAVALLRSFGARPRGGREILTARRFLLRRFAAPTPRLATGRRLAEAGVVSAMIDVSDGLLRDLGHICENSGVGAIVDEDALPVSAAYRRIVGADAGAALHGGEDYELLFSVPPSRLARFERLRRLLPDPVRPIGEIVARPRSVRVRDRGGRARRPADPGFEHFRPA